LLIGFKNKMKVVILAGGFGTRLSEYTQKIPKPMVKINNKPILIHIIEHYLKYGFKEFYIALGFKANYIKKYFKNKKINYQINLIDTGLNTMTGGRLRRLKKFFSRNEDFMMTYGDSVSNVNLKKLKKFHEKQRSLVTMTTVKPTARFGAVKIRGDKIIYFKEKSNVDVGWINGGFMVINQKFLNYIRSDSTFLEKEPLEKACKTKQLSAFKHTGFWHCMDTKRDKDRLEKIFKSKKL
tara:strand:+ start:8838 stop:9551 length:714 start_codon:yes stop_codon:yes gene_type:complete